MAGAISATGAQGGAVETSGRFALDIAASARVEVGAGGSWLLDPRNIVIDERGASIGGGTSTPPAGAGPWRVDAGAIFVGANVTWSGDSDLRLVADDNLTVNYNMLSTGAGDLTLEAGTDFILDAKILSATGSGDLTIDAGRDLAIRAHPTNTRTISTEEGASRSTSAATSHRPERGGGGAPQHADLLDLWRALDMTAGRAIDLRGGALGGTWVRVGQQGSSADVTLRAPTVSFRGGGAGNTYAELVGGAEGSITVAASERIVFANGAGDQGRVQASNGASLTLRAPVHVWDGPVRAGSGAQDGGETVIAGAVSASFQPQFSLRRGANFTFEPKAQGGAASSYASTEPFEVTTSGTGAIEIGAPVSARQVTLISAEQVGLGLAGSLYGAGAAGLTDGVIVAAGRQFRNDSALGAGAVSTGASARWLVYVNTFAGLVGPAPGPRSFDLYGRTYVSAPPENRGFSGNRIVYGERSTLTLTGATISKTYGDAVTFGAGLPGYTVAGYRPGDSAATALAGAPVVASPGAAMGTGVLGWPYAVNVAATASAQGYRLEFVPGTLIVRPAALTVHVDDQRWLYGGADPTLTWTATGFVNGEDARVITGALSTDARPRRWRARAAGSSCAASGCKGRRRRPRASSRRSGRA